MKSFIALFLLISLVATSVRSECVPACNSKYGVCQSSTEFNVTGGNSYERYYCFCTTLWEGETCDTPWRNDPQWMKLVTGYQIWNVLVFTGLFIWSTYELYLIFTRSTSTSNDSSKLTIVTYSLTLVAVGAFLRVFLFCLDPHSIKGILPVEAYGILLSLPIIAWLSGGFGICIFWMELNQNLGLNKVEFVTQLRPFLFFLVGLSWALLIPASLFLSIKNNTPSLYFYNLSCVSLFAIFLIIAITFGVKLVKQLGKSKTSAAKRFLSRITFHMVGVAITLVLASVTALSFIFLGNNAKYPYIIIHWILRVEEIVVTSLCVILFTRRMPKREKNGTESSTEASKYKISVKSAELYSDISCEVKEADIEVEPKYEEDTEVIQFNEA